jgi:hypothetical protein
MQNNTTKFKKDLMSREKKLWGNSSTKFVKSSEGKRWQTMADKQIKRTKALIKSIKVSYILKIKNIKKNKQIHPVKNKYLQLILLKNGKLELMMGHNIDELNGPTDRKGVYFNVPVNVPSITLVKIHLNKNDLHFTIKSFKLMHIQITLDLTEGEQEKLSKIIENSKGKTKKNTKKNIKKNKTLNIKNKGTKKMLR